MDLLNIFHILILSSLVGSLIVLIILIAKGIFRNKLSSTFHYYIWAILIIKLIIPFGPQNSFNISNIYEKYSLQNKIIKQETNINNLKQPENIDSGDLASTGTSQLSNTKILSSVQNIPLKNKINIDKFLCYVWGIGVVLIITTLIVGYRRLSKIVRISNKDIANRHNEILRDCMNTMDINSKVEILYSPHSTQISSPSLCGFFKPKILIPINIALNVSDEEFKCILMHELSHLKSKDICVNWFITLLSVAYWFNPILLYSFRKIKQDCELHCDSKVIAYLGEGENLKYGNTIIRILELGGSSNKLIGTASMVMNSSEIKRRITMISNYKKLSVKNILLSIAVVIVIIGFSILMNTSKVKSASMQTKASLNKSTAKIDSNITQSHIIKAVHIHDASKSTVPFSSDIVIYNSHPDEDYPSGIKVADVAYTINDELVKEGLKSCFISCAPPKEYSLSYSITRELITKNVVNYNKTILLDIHRDMANKNNSDKNKILFILAKNNPYYEANKKFTDLIMDNIKNSSQVKTDEIFYHNGLSRFNQDLSNNSVLIEIGNNMSSDADIEECINALVSALKNIQNGLSH